MNVALRLKSLRKDRNLSQYRLAKKSGVSQSFLSTLESGQKTPTIDTLEKLCNALGISLSEFFNTHCTDIPDHLILLVEEGRHLSPMQVEKLVDLLASLRKEQNPLT
jgi:HTH-type transcriptional repressor of puuD